MSKYKQAVRNLEDFPMSTFLEKAEEELKGKSFVGVEKYIFYDAIDDSFFSMLKASTNWAWAPDNDDARFYVSVYHSGPEDVFNTEEYIYDSIRAGTIEDLLKNFNIEMTEELKYWIKEQRADKIENLLTKEQKKELVEESFEFEKDWLKKQAQEKVEHTIDKFEYRIRKQKEGKEMFSKNL